MELREKMCTKLVVAWLFKVKKMRSIVYSSNISIARNPSTDRNRNNRRPVEMQ